MANTGGTAITPVDWDARRLAAINDASRGNPSRQEYAEANAGAIVNVVAGVGPDTPPGSTDSGIHAVANIAAVHIPAFARIPTDKTSYKNAYDLGKCAIVGHRGPNHVRKRREMVDECLPIGAHTGKDVYFCAVEVNGTGIRFYGDICLVLKDVQDDTVVLDRNSYDVERSPIVDRIHRFVTTQQDQARKDELSNLAGTWSTDLRPMAVVRVLDAIGGGLRRLTSGQVSDAILNDEDYMEVLRIGSFGASDLSEVRVSSADAAQDAIVGDRLRLGPTPRYEALLWRQRRRRAERVLQSAGVTTRVVTTTGRVR